MNTALGLAAVVVLIGANAFFVAVEFALVVVDRARVGADADAGVRPWPTVQRLVNNLSFNLSGAQFGITVSSLLLGYVAEPVAQTLLSPILRPLFGDAADGTLSLVIVFILSTGFQLVLGELVPKNIAIADPERILRRYAVPADVYGRVAGPLIRVANDSAEWAVRSMGIEPVDELHGISSIEELEHLIRSSGEEGTLDPQDVTILTRTIRFAEKKVADALVPRVDVQSIGHDATITDLIALSTESGHSRFPVTGDGLDDIRGVVTVKSIHGVAVADRPTTSVSTVMVAPWVVPEAAELEEILKEMRQSRSPLAVVVDEHGGMEGILTIEDIVEEIVGEIEDEHDPEPEQPREVGGSFVMSGSLHPDEVEEACGFKVPEGHYETLAGFVLDQLQRVPAKGEILDYDGWRLEIAEMDRWRIAELQLTKVHATTLDDTEVAGR